MPGRMKLLHEEHPTEYQAPHASGSPILNICALLKIKTDQFKVNQ